MKLLGLVNVALLLLAGEGLGEGAGEGGAGHLAGIEAKVVAEEALDKERLDVGKDSTVSSSSNLEREDLNNSGNAEEETTSNSPSPGDPNSSDGKDGLDGSEDETVVDGGEENPTGNSSPAPEFPCTVCSCSTQDASGNSKKIKSNVLVQNSSNLIQIDCSDLSLTTWLPMQGSTLVVDFSHNLLTRVPMFTQGIVSLDLSYNQLTDLPPLHFADLAASLLNLNLAGNNLAMEGLSDTSLQMDPEQHLSQAWSLETLSLADNRLHSLPADIFGQLGGLQNLDLSSNPLSEMDAATIQAIGGIASLVSLSLADCRLASLSHGLLDGLTQLESFDLSGNPFDTLRLWYGESLVW